MIIFYKLRLTTLKKKKKKPHILFILESFNLCIFIFFVVLRNLLHVRVRIFKKENMFKSFKEKIILSSLEKFLLFIFGVLFVVP